MVVAYLSFQRDWARYQVSTKQGRVQARADPGCGEARGIGKRMLPVKTGTAPPPGMFSMLLEVGLEVL
ncbi:hypothetical protein HMPREF0277_0378 [Corynebacterium accolens ATCC 49726]|nr:hypothetical protein HMPREF0277_0378 [Corynebacterium accolens ATCC 49726]